MSVDAKHVISLLSHTFKDDENEADVAQSEKGVLPLESQNIPDGNSVEETNNNLADEPGPKNIVRCPFCDGKKKEKRDQRQDADDCRSVLARSKQIDRRLMGRDALLGSWYLRKAPPSAAAICVKYVRSENASPKEMCVLPRAALEVVDAGVELKRDAEEFEVGVLAGTAPVPRQDAMTKAGHDSSPIPPLDFLWGGGEWARLSEIVLKTTFSQTFDNLGDLKRWR